MRVGKKNIRWYRAPIPRHTVLRSIDNTSEAVGPHSIRSHPCSGQGGCILLAWACIALHRFIAHPETIAAVGGRSGLGLAVLRRKLTISSVALLISMAAPMAAAETCDSALYGNLCGAQELRPTNQRRPTPSLPPVQGVGGDQWARQDRPGTLGAITFQGGKQCIGLLRRSNCN